MAVSLGPLRGAAEAARGLRFPGAVDARLLPPEALDRTLREEYDLGLPPELARRDGRLKVALGLLPPGTDLRAAVIGLQGRAIVGYYTPIRRRLYVVADAGPRLPPAVAGVAVHELVHALQDVHSRLLEVQLGLVEHDDLSFALGALLEGDATWATFRWEEEQQGVEPLSAEEFSRDFGVEWAQAEHGATPRWLREMFLLQYPFGYVLANALAEAGGVAALDAALADPPLSSEELLHPERYLDPRRRRGLAILDVEARLRGEPGCQIVAANGFGEIGLRIWARERGLDGPAAEALGEGWDADRAALARCPGGQRLAWLLQFDDAAAARRFAAAVGPLVVALPQPLAVAARDRRVLLSAGLADEAARQELLSASEQRYRNLEAFLAAHPQVGERARRLRAR